MRGFVTRGYRARFQNAIRNAIRGRVGTRGRLIKAPFSRLLFITMTTAQQQQQQDELNEKRSDEIAQKVFDKVDEMEKNGDQNEDYLWATFEFPTNYDQKVLIMTMDKIVTIAKKRYRAKKFVFEHNLRNRQFVVEMHLPCAVQLALDYDQLLKTIEGR